MEQVQLESRIKLQGIIIINRESSGNAFKLSIYDARKQLKYVNTSWTVKLFC